jgi:histidinol dehydrogenase
MAWSASTPWPGPSEIVVVADAPTIPEWIAADLLSQAEHDPGRAIHPDHRRLRPFASASRRRRGAAADPGDRRGRRGRRGATTVRGHRAADGRAALVGPDRARARRIRRRGDPSGWPTGCGTPGASSWAARARGDRRLCGRLQPRAAHQPGGAVLVGLSLFDFLKRTSIVKCDAAAFAILGPADHRAGRGRRAAGARPFGRHPADPGPLAAGTGATAQALPARGPSPQRPRPLRPPMRR